MKYYVTIPTSGYIVWMVEAEDEHEAKEKAMNGEGEINETWADVAPMLVEKGEIHARRTI